MSIPGMNDPIEIDLKVSRRNVLLLSQAINKALRRGQSKMEKNTTDPWEWGKYSNSVQA